MTQFLSFRGASEASEPGIQGDKGSASFAAPGFRARACGPSRNDRGGERA